MTCRLDRVLVWKFDRFARSTRHLLAALEEFDHLLPILIW
jgi:DNA invertase Pin-like site-specific DNA recombinase